MYRIMSTYQSDQFKLNVGRWRQPGQLAQLGNGLAWIGNGTSEDLYLYTKDLGKLLQGEVKHVEKDWHERELRDCGVSEATDGIKVKLKTNHGTASAVVGNTAYFFWVDAQEGTLCALPMTLKADSEAFAFDLGAKPLVIYGAGTFHHRVKGIASDLSATVYQGHVLLTYGDATGAVTHLKLGFAEQDLRTNKGIWSAVSSHTSRVNFTPTDLNYSATQPSTEWFTLGPAQDYLMVLLYNAATQQVLGTTFKMGADGMPSDQSPRRVADFLASGSVSLRRDPSGRLVVVYGKYNDQHQLMSRVYRTVAEQADAAGEPILGKSFEREVALNQATWTTHTGVAHVFVKGVDHSHAVQLPTKDAGDQRFPAILADVYHITLYGHGDPDGRAYSIQGQVAGYGQVAFVQDVAQLHPPQSGPMVLTAVMEPFPLPQGMLDAYPQVSVRTIYGTEARDDRRHQVALNTQYGIRAAYKTKSGLGPAADFQMSAGPSVGIAHQQQTSIETEFVSYAGGAKGYHDGTRLLPYGELWGMSQPPIFEDGLYFFDRIGNLINGKDAPFFSQFRIDLDNSSATTITQPYELYSTRQGDLSSYTEAAINQKMRAAYLALPLEDQQKLHPGYASNYFRDVIVPHAYAFEATSASDPEKGRYLSYHIGQGSMRETYNEIRSAMREWGWEVNYSSYLGVSGGSSASGGIGIFNVEMVGFEAEALVGFTFSGSVNESGTHTDSLRLSVDLSQVKPHYPSYEVRLYLLPSNPLWAQEISLFSPNGPGLRGKVDLANSAPFKIFFRVIQNA